MQGQFIIRTIQYIDIPKMQFRLKSSHGMNLNCRANGEIGNLEESKSKKKVCKMAHFLAAYAEMKFEGALFGMQHLL